ncbi:bacillithiol biosynthesis deacetylase BshB1 [Fulvivirga sp. M361]|uniref:bacillithiol biosynthesis deacetylase BshB1 n=1 Tax=Fulvivirga sp. M361 TaxID=2594266 RepID=UPI00117A9C27|nr:bacillithiol biosynthesis deacetylase BshB1 [Fulvivirga sp. M361]TRX51748.1 bacillithiol biosynthesis deacetylase BshB1 [Fulvivirga sp. M361]
MTKLDILAFAAHPDDTELSCAGTLASHIAKGYKVGVVDLTRGELGTRGTPEIRDKEAKASAEILGLAVRSNLEMEDGFFEADRTNQLKLVRAIRTYRPTILFANAIKDRHPDHGRGAKLAVEATFLSGLVKIEVKDDDGQLLAPWRPQVVYHYIQSQFISPDLIVDVSAHWDKKMEAIRAFKSQFHDPDNDEPDTYISSPQFMEMIEGRGKELGHSIGVAYGEGFTVNRNIGVTDLFNLK